MKKLITILTAMIVIVAFSAGSLLAANATGYGGIIFKNYTFSKDTCTTSMNISLNGDYRCSYFIGAEVHKADGSMPDSKTDGWSYSYCNVSTSIKAEAYGCSCGYGIYVGKNENETIITSGCGPAYAQ
ncbi:MAG: hypothetical protein PHP22_09985 [Oscillospiraceae bacterium]|nr:hypothetical protein [Oscillospiraceae bacterium]